MVKMQLLLILGVLVALNSGEGDGVLPPQPPSPATKPPTTTSTTVKPTTATAPTTPPTSPTTPPTTSPTTSPPTTPPPTPSPAPPKPVDPEVGVWQVNYTDTNKTCLLVQFSLQIEIPYNTTFNKTYTAPIDVPKNAEAVGACGDKIQNITLKWNPIENVTTVVDNIILVFAENATSKNYKLQGIEVNITPDKDNFPGYNGTDSLKLTHHQDEFTTSVSRSYKCVKKQKLNLTDSDNKLKGHIYVSHLQFQAFYNTTTKQFTTAEECSPFDTPDIVPIVVGCSLVGLIIIVLVAYLFGRKRRQARGYLSMFTQTKTESDYIPMKNLSCFK